MAQVLLRGSRRRGAGINGWWLICTFSPVGLGVCGWGVGRGGAAGTDQSGLAAVRIGATSDADGRLALIVQGACRASGAVRAVWVCRDRMPQCAGSGSGILQMIYILVFLSPARTGPGSHM